MACLTTIDICCSRYDVSSNARHVARCLDILIGCALVIIAALAIYNKLSLGGIATTYAVLGTGVTYLGLVLYRLIADRKAFVC